MSTLLDPFSGPAGVALIIQEDPALGDVNPWFVTGANIPDGNFHKHFFRSDDRPYSPEFASLTAAERWCEVRAIKYQVRPFA